MSSYVLVEYHGELYPGLVTKVKKRGFQVSCLAKSGKNKWIWPEEPDECYYEPREVKEIIAAPEIINNRGQMYVKELEKLALRNK